MPPRLNKRQLREIEELSALSSPTDKTNPDVSEEVMEEDEEEQAVISKTPGFAAASSRHLISQNAEESDEDEDIPVKSAKSKKSKKKKKKDAVAEAPSSQPLIPAISKKDKKAAKKQKAKEKKDDPMDLEKALAELSVKYGDIQKATAKNSLGPDFSSLLAVSVQHLDSESEMRKFFGAKVVAAASKANAQSSSLTARRKTAVQRSHLTRPKSAWWPPQLREGLSIRQLSEEETADKLFRHGWNDDMNETWWTVEYSKKYRGVTMAFMRTVMSGDPEGFNNLLRALPYHADTLLQLSEVYNHREEYSTASDFVDRALFSYERSFVGSFNFTNGTNRLEFDRVENRPFFLALHRQIVDLQRRGCNRTSFEFAKLMYSLDPWSDPHGALLHLDSLAIRAGMSDWLLDVWNFFDSHNKEFQSRWNVQALPGWWYSRALALKVKGNVESTKALGEAIERFPSILPLLADKLDVSLSTDIRDHPKFRVHTDASSLSKQQDAVVHLLCHLYVQRVLPLWKKAEIVEWFTATVKSITPALLYTSTKPTEGSEHLSLPFLQCSIYRHVMFLEQSTRPLFPFIPKEVLNKRQIACDPLPPPSSINEYNDAFFKGVEDVLAYNPRRRNRREDERMLERLIPDPVFRRQLQAFFETHPQFAARFPGGIVHFAQIAAQLPEDALEDLMIAEADNLGEGQIGVDGMPGGMPGLDIDEGEPGEVIDQGGVDEDDDEDVAPLPVRFLRNVVNRFFGVVPTEGIDSDSENENPAARDQGGID